MSGNNAQTVGLNNIEEDFMNKPYCIICGKRLSGGIIIKGARICKACEERIVSTQVDTDFYEYYKECIKNKLVHSILKGESFNCRNYRL